MDFEQLRWNLEALVNPPGKLSPFEKAAIQSFINDFCRGVSDEDEEG